VRYNAMILEALLVLKDAKSDLNGIVNFIEETHLGLVGNAKTFVETLNKEIKDNPFCLVKKHPWVEGKWKKSKDNAAKMEAYIAKDILPFNFLTPMRIIR
ncbi:hypothetical protein S83_046999, partial [Arachis hypogaea]